MKIIFDVAHLYYLPQYLSVYKILADKKVDSQDGLTIVYILLQLDVSDDIKLLKNEVERDKKLRRKMDEKGLLKILDGL